MTPEIGKLVPGRPVANSQPATRMTTEISTTLTTLTQPGAMSEPILRCDATGADLRDHDPGDTGERRAAWWGC